MKFIICGDINIDISNNSVIGTKYQNISSLMDLFHVLIISLRVSITLTHVLIIFLQKI